MNLQSQFNAIAQHYDRQRTRLIPCFDDFYGIAVDNLELSADCPQILDLGAGTGLFSEFVLQKYPQAQITLVDISEKMLDIARERFATKSNVHILCQDFTIFSAAKQYDAVISSLAIHHLEDEAKKKLYGSIYTMLKDNGLFIHAEQVAGETPFTAALNDRKWIEHVENTDLTREELDAGYERVKLDKRAPLSLQMEWLRSCGFIDVDCLFKYYDFTVIYCKK